MLRTMLHYKNALRLNVDITDAVSFNYSDNDCVEQIHNNMSISLVPPGSTQLFVIVPEKRESLVSMLYTELRYK